MDTVQIALTITKLALAIAVTGAAFVASRNLGSSTLSISTAALVGTATIFVLQSYFELQPRTDTDHVTTNFTLDASSLGLRQWTYPLTAMSRQNVEITASNWLKEHNPEAFDTDRDKLFADFTIFSFVSFMMTTEFDWQLRRVEYPAGRFGTATTLQPISTSQECRTYTVEELEDKLKSAGNLFADALTVSMPRHRLCLPSNTRVDITKRSIAFQNYFARITWKVDEGFAFMSHTDASMSGEVPLLKSGKPRFETRTGGINVDVTYLNFRAKSLEMPKYKAWIDRIVRDSHAWFETQS